MEIYTIKVGEVFTTTPIARFRTESKYSGEVFRDDILIPALEKYPQVTVDLGGTEGYNSSWLEEVFGGLVRKLWPDPLNDSGCDRLDWASAKRALSIISSDPQLKRFVESAYIFMNAADSQERRRNNPIKLAFKNLQKVLPEMDYCHIKSMWDKTNSFLKVCQCLPILSGESGKIARKEFDIQLDKAWNPNPEDSDSE